MNMKKIIEYITGKPKVAANIAPHVDIYTGHWTSYKRKDQAITLIENIANLRRHIIIKRLERSLQTVIVEAKGEPIGTVTLKLPPSSYVRRVMLLGNWEPDFMPTAELGYLFVSPEYRRTGIGAALLSNLDGVLKLVPTFATCEVGNEHVIKMLQRIGFSVVGQPYNSITHGDKNTTPNQICILYRPI